MLQWVSCDMGMADACCSTRGHASVVTEWSCVDGPDQLFSSCSRAEATWSETLNTTDTFALKCVICFVMFLLLS